jgi:hypothetical protein
MLVLRLSVHSPVEAPSPDRYAAVIPAHWTIRHPMRAPQNT